MQRRLVVGGGVIAREGRVMLTAEVPLLGKAVMRRLIPARTRCWMNYAAYQLRTLARSLSPDPRTGRAIRRLFEMHQGRRGTIAVMAVGTAQDWTHVLHGRFQQLAKAFARAGYLVLYCTPNSRDRVRGIEKVGESLYLCASPSALRGIPEMTVYFFFPGQRPVAELFLRKSRVIYDYVDDLRVYPVGVRKFEADHRWFVRHASVVTATATRLYEEVKRLRPDALLCPNGVEYNEFRPKQERKPPGDIARLAGVPIVGFFGALANWVDWKLVHSVAKLCPDVHFVLIGPKYGDRTGSESLDWSLTPNVHFLGARPYSVLPSYAWHFSVGMIPFLVDDVTAATSPVKLFEYLAAGLPVVSTDIPECRRYRSVFIAKGPEEFARAIRSALNGAIPRDVIEAEAVANTWDSRAQLILGALGGKQSSS